MNQPPQPPPSYLCSKCHLPSPVYFSHSRIFGLTPMSECHKTRATLAPPETEP